jgi:hypothetical protein
MDEWIEKDVTAVVPNRTGEDESIESIAALLSPAIAPTLPTLPPTPAPALALPTTTGFAVPELSKPIVHTAAALSKTLALYGKESMELIEEDCGVDVNVADDDDDDDDDDDGGDWDNGD